MNNRVVKFLLLACVAALSACQTPVVDETGPLAIRSVSVSTQPAVESATEIAPPLQVAASEALVGGDPAGTPANVQISVEKVTYKDPLASLLIGSTNSLNTRVTVTSESGAVLANFPHRTVLNAAINGIIGAVIAASQDRAAVDRELVETHARTLKVRVYGKPGHRPKMAAPAASAKPVPAVPEPAPEPADPTGIPVS